MKRLLHSLLLLAIVNTLDAAVFQFSVAVTTARETNRAWLWIPPSAPQVRGVVMAGMTLMEREFVKDETIRRACADEHLALVFLNCGLSSPDLPQVLAELASVSGYDELARAPLFFVGHLAGGPQAKACAIKFADRCFGVVQYRGGVPGGSNSVPPGIPALMMLGSCATIPGARHGKADVTSSPPFAPWTSAISAVSSLNQVPDISRGPNGTPISLLSSSARRRRRASRQRVSCAPLITAAAG